jgi:hypothetical protein
MIIGWVNSNLQPSYNLDIIEEGTAYDTEKKRPAGGLRIRKLKDYDITVYDFETGSWDVEESKIERGLSAAKIKAESMLNKLISLN